MLNFEALKKQRRKSGRFAYLTDHDRARPRYRAQFLVRFHRPGSKINYEHPDSWILLNRHRADTQPEIRIRTR
jgi:hypothetical protein